MPTGAVGGGGGNYSRAAAPLSGLNTASANLYGAGLLAAAAVASALHAAAALLGSGTLTATASTGTVSDGRAINATNTGYVGAGVTLGSLTSSSGMTINTSGTSGAPYVVSGYNFTGQVVINGDYVTLTNFNTSAQLDGGQIQVNGNYATIQYGTLDPGGSGGALSGVFVPAAATGTTVLRCNFAHQEQFWTTYGNNVQFLECLGNDPLPQAVGGHVDGCEVYGGATIMIARCNLKYLNGTLSDGVINIAPWQSGVSVTDLTMQDNWLDGADAIMLVDNQSTGDVLRTRFLRNWCGGHQRTDIFGRYMVLQNSDSRTISTTEADLVANPTRILIPDSGADANYWYGNSDLSPNNDGTVVAAR